MKKMTKQANILFILSDDQGSWAMRCAGNNEIDTPNLDRLARTGMRFENFFCTSPVCSPARASLLTGRIPSQHGVHCFLRAGHLQVGPEARCTLADFTSLPEVLDDAGYNCGLVGKWHLGDNYPMRTIDQGFDESIVHKGGGIGYPDDPPGNSYFDPILQHNGKPEKFKGYCMDVYTDATIKFVEDNKDKPFFVYLSTNTVHTPLQISDEYVAPYKAMGLTDKTARVYGMVTNIDDNFSRLLAKLKESGLEDNTIVIFMSDNGPSQGVVEDDRYSAGLREIGRAHV